MGTVTRKKQDGIRAAVRIVEKKVSRVMYSLCVQGQKNIPV